MKSKLRSLGIKKQEQLLDRLREVIRSAEMEDADFGKHTALIKEQTRVYRHSWIVSPLNAIVRMIESNGELVKSVEDSER